MVTYRTRPEEGPRCRFHELAPSTEQCTRCGAPVCDVCVSFAASRGVACQGCQQVVRRGRALQGAGVAALLLAALGGVTAAYVHAAAPMQLRPSDLDEARRALEENPCEEREMTRLATALHRAGRHWDVVERGEAFLAECGHSERVLWKIHTAHQRVGNHREAERTATRLLERDPRDGVYHCWRAESRALLGKLEEAAADYEQCIALRPHLRDAPVLLANVYRDLGRPCDGIAPLLQRLHVDATGRAGRPSRAVMELASELATSAECQHLAVTGQALLPFGDELWARGEASIDGKAKGVFYVDTGLSHVLVRRAFADRIGLSAGPRVLRVWTPNGIQEAKLAVAGRLEVEGASAPNVPLAIVEDLPDADGALGRAFLLRFRVLRTEMGYTLSPPPAAEHAPAR